MFTPRWQKEHWVPRDPAIDEDANHDPVHGDVLAFDSAVGKFVSATPPVVPGIGALINDKDLIWWDAADNQLEPVTPTLAADEAGTLGLDGEILTWNETGGVWEASGFVVLEPAYAHIYAQDAAVAQAVTGAPSKVTAFAADGVSNLATPDHTADSITIVENGIYEVDLSVTYTYGAAAVVQMHVLVDAAESIIGFQQETLNALDVMTAHAHAPLALEAAEVITVYVEASADNNITISDISLSVRRIDNYIPVV